MWRLRLILKELFYKQAPVSNRNSQLVVRATNQRLRVGFSLSQPGQVSAEGRRKKERKEGRGASFQAKCQVQPDRIGL